MKYAIKITVTSTVFIADAQGHIIENNLWQDFKAVTVIIDPSTGKLIDIESFNYYYDYAVGSNSLTFTRRYPSMTLYKYGN